MTIKAYIKITLLNFTIDVQPHCKQERCLSFLFHANKQPLYRSFTCGVLTAWSTKIFLNGKHIFEQIMKLYKGQDTRHWSNICQWEKLNKTSSAF